jgi:gamma-glutamyltranspeptidase
MRAVLRERGTRTGGLPERAATTHYSIVDRFGNAVAVTYTINELFGAGVIGGDTGFLLNDEMDDFTGKPGVANLYGARRSEGDFFGASDPRRRSGLALGHGFREAETCR